MVRNSKKIIAVVGPTSSGKSDLAVAIAKKFGGEIISADSRQIYRGMDIGTGKITRTEMRGVPHHLLDIVSPTRRQNFSVSEFKKLADRAVAEIEKRGRLPILAGGTGFWADAVAFNRSFPEVPPNPKLRAKLEKLSLEKLSDELLRLAPARAANIDLKNKRRVVRAIEIAKAMRGKNFEVIEAPTHEVLFIGLDMPDKKLFGAIAARLAKRIRKGLVSEVARLHKNGVSWKKLEGFGLEYKFVAQHLQGKLGMAEMTELLTTAIRQYAKRQRTWFKRNKQTYWLNAANKKTALRQSLKLVQKFI